MIRLAILLCVPALAYATHDFVPLFDESLGRLSQELNSSTPDIGNFFYSWTENFYYILKQECNLTCPKGLAGPLSGLYRPADQPISRTGSLLSASAVLPDFLYYYEQCVLMFGFSGTEHYSGWVFDNEIDVRFEVHDTGDRCRATVVNADLQGKTDMDFNKDNGGVRYLKTMGSYEKVKEHFRQHLRQKLNAYLNSYVGRTYDLSVNCKDYNN